MSSNLIYLGHISCLTLPTEDQKRSLYLTLWGTMPQSKIKRLVEKGDSRENHSYKSYISTIIITLDKPKTSNHKNIEELNKTFLKKMSKTNMSIAHDAWFRILKGQNDANEKFPIRHRKRSQ